MHFSLFSIALALGSPFAHAAHTWKNVKIGGGGGFIPGIVFSPSTKGVAYARTDIGGLYRLNADDSWTAITDSITTDATWHNWGIDALAVDPQNSENVYAAVGMYTNSWDPNNGAIIRSPDGGNTWSSTALSFKVGGNMPGRGMGERLAVDPQNSKIIYFGARSGNGLWKSTDGGVTFSKVSSFTAVGTYIADPTDTTGYNNDIQGLAWITFDPTSGLTNGATSRIFVGTADKTTSIYVSTDAGATWKVVAGQPTGNLPHKGKIQPTEKALYVTYSDTSGPYDGATGSVNRYDLAAGTWKDITPVSGSDLYFGFGGLALDTKKPGTLMVVSLNSWYPDAQIFRSNNSGTTWSKIWEWSSYPNQNRYYSLSTAKAPWITNSIQQGDTKLLGWMIESLEIDPFDSDHWLYGTGLTMYGGHDLTKWDTVHNVTIQSLADGIEETSVQDLASVPGGSALLAAVGDDGGFTFKTSLTTSPNIEWVNPLNPTTVGVDYAGNKPASVVRVGNTNGGTQQCAVSTDGGATWNVNYASSGGQYGGKVAYSANADTILWSSSTGVLRSLNSGAFSAVSALPSGAAIASDKVSNSNFYVGSGSSFYVSTDGGATFTKSSPLGSATAVRDVAVHPTVAGDVWVSTDAGIFHSTDAGKTFSSALGGLTNGYSIALGKGLGTYPNVYAFGTASAGNKLYGSGDQGKTWTDVQGGQGFGSISDCPLAASMDVAGQVYVGTNGRGVFYGTGSIPAGSGPSSTSTASAMPTSTTKIPTTLSTTTKPPVTTTTVVPTTTTKPPTTTTKVSTTTSPPPKTTTPVNCAAKYGQCGGMGWTGPTCCAAGSTCQVSNPYYSQCL